MSTYTELCDAYLASRARLEECREACAKQYEAMCNHLMQYLDIPKEALRYINLNVEPSDAVYTIPGAVTLGNDGFWHLGLVVTFHKEGTAPAFQLLFDIHLQEVNQGFLVKLSGDEQGVLVHPGNEKDFDRFADLFGGNVRNWFETYAERVLSTDENVYEGHGTYL